MLNKSDNLTYIKHIIYIKRLHIQCIFKFLYISCINNITTNQKKKNTINSKKKIKKNEKMRHLNTFKNNKERLDEIVIILLISYNNYTK